MIYHVFANRSNIGDWLSARAIQSLLGVAVVELLCDEPFVAETIACLSRATRDDVVIIGGGGLFMDYFGPFWEAFEPISRQVAFYIWGVGCCDMKRAGSLPERHLLEQIVTRSRICVVRDELTRGFLADCKLASAVVCPSITMFGREPGGHGILHVDALDNVGDGTYEAMNAAAREFSRATNRSFAAINNEIPADSERALDAVLDKYRDADLVLTGRLHGCIIGLAMGRRVLAVSGDRKIESFMHAARLDEWVVEFDRPDAIADALGRLDAQQWPGHFVEAARRDNQRVASSIRARLRVMAS